MIVGALLRIGWAVATPEEPQWDPVPSDPGWYMHLGDMVSNGDGYSYIVKTGPDDLDLEAQSTGYYPPGYPLVLGGLFWATETATDVLPFDVSDLDAAVALNVVLSVATIALVFELGRRVVNARAGLAAAAVVALWPNLIFHSGVVLTETLTLFLLVTMYLIALASSRVARAPGIWRLLTVGVLFGLVGLVRPTSLVLGPLFGLFWFFNARSGSLREDDRQAFMRRALVAVRSTAVVAVGTLLVILPWTARNWAQLGDPVLISTNTGDNVCIGYNPDATGGYGDPGDYCLGGLNTHDPTVESRGEYDVRRQSETLERARQSIEDSPQRIFTLMPDRLRRTLWDDSDGLAAANDYGRRSNPEPLSDPFLDVQELFSSGTRNLLRSGANLYYLGAIAVTAAGAWLLARHSRTGRGDPGGRRWFLAAAALTQLVPPLITFGDARFKMPIYPTMAILAGAAAVVAVWAAGVLLTLLKHVRQTGFARGPRGLPVLYKLLVQALKNGALSAWGDQLAPDAEPEPDPGEGEPASQDAAPPLVTTSPET